MHATKRSLPSKGREPPRAFGDHFHGVSSHSVRASSRNKKDDCEERAGHYRGGSCLQQVGAIPPLVDTVHSAMTAPVTENVAKR